jgi:hypothetical protein
MGSSGKHRGREEDANDRLDQPRLGPCGARVAQVRDDIIQETFMQETFGIQETFGHAAATACAPSGPGNRARARAALKLRRDRAIAIAPLI